MGSDQSSNLELFLKYQAFFHEDDTIISISLRFFEHGFNWKKEVLVDLHNPIAPAGNVQYQSQFSLNSYLTQSSSVAVIGPNFYVASNEGWILGQIFLSA